MEPYAFGIDIGGTAIKLGLFQTDGQLLEKWKIPTRTVDHGIHVLPDALRAVAEKAAERAIPWEQILGAGVGVPGPVSEDGTVCRCVNLNWGVFNVPAQMRALEPRLKVIRAANDVNAAALGELWQGGAKGRESAFMVTLGTGIGGGLIFHGQIVTGFQGGAGEIGHLCIDPNEPEQCGCGKRGCLEQYCSANGLVRCARRALAGEPERPTVLRKQGELLTAKRICDAAKAGDALALELVDRLGEQVGWALTAVAGAVNPQVFVIGGGLANAGLFLLERIERGYRKYAFHVYRDTAFTLAELGNDAGICGCVRMLLK